MDGSLTDAAIVGLLCRTSDRAGCTGHGTRELAVALAAQLGTTPRLVGEPGEPRDSLWEEDLAECRGCLLEAGGQLADALAAGRFPVLCAPSCSICVSTLPVLARDRPDAFVLWLDAHADFNSPGTSPSGFLGGMCLAAACGVWDDGLGLTALDPSRVVMCGVRDVDPGERVLLDTRGVSRIDRPSRLADALAGREVFVHLDLDVLDPSVLPGSSYPVPGGFSAEGLRRMLAEVREVASVVGIEVTGCPDGDGAAISAPAVAALLT